MNNNKHYPKDYTGPKAGISSNEEWVSVTEYQAFKWLRDAVWNYSDFDCWLYSFVENKINILTKEKSSNLETKN